MRNSGRELNSNDEKKECVCKKKNACALAAQLMNPRYERIISTSPEFLSTLQPVQANRVTALLRLVLHGPYEHF